MANEPRELGTPNSGLRTRDPELPLHVARQVIQDEARALSLLAETLTDSGARGASTGTDAAHPFQPALSTLLRLFSQNGQLIVSGLGKSGDIARKIAATLTSTGSPAVCMHPVEALHGDLGIVTRQHGLLALSRSGNTEEMLRFVAHFRRLGGPVIGVTMGRESRLAELSDHTILLPSVPETGPLNLAPTTSCVLMLALGDALAMALLHARGFKTEDFAQYHPDGTLGRRLLLRAEDLMHGGDDLPLVRADEPFRELLHTMTAKRLGLAVLVESDGRLLGTFTDGDLRRVLERVENPLQADARTAHQRSRRTSESPPVLASAIEPSRPAIDCLRLMQESQITSLIVVDDAGRPLGVLRLMDLLAAGLG
jgi:arabinose-5-phosphate isomerase